MKPPVCRICGAGHWGPICPGNAVEKSEKGREPDIGRVAVAMAREVDELRERITILLAERDELQRQLSMAQSKQAATDAVRAVCPVCEARRAKRRKK